jgi:hypothetical protein
LDFNKNQVLDLIQFFIMAQANRGLTTAGLLHLAAQIIQNRDFQTARKKTVNLRSDIQKEFPGIPLPDKVGTKALKDLKKADWIHGGNEADAWRAKNAQGAALEQYRQRLYDFVINNGGWLAQQYWPPARRPGSPKGTPPEANKGSSLNELFASTGYKLDAGLDEKGKRKYRQPDTFEERMTALRAVLALTQRDVEPGARQISARGGFQRGPANQAQAMAAINGGVYDGKEYKASNGFVVEKLAEFLAAKVSAKDPALVPAANATAEQLMRINQTNESLRALHQSYKAEVAPMLVGAQGAVATKDLKAAILALGKNPAALHAAVVRVNQALGGQLSSLLWSIASTSRIGNVLSGYNIAKPQIGVKPKVGTEKEVALREWVWRPDVAADGSDPVNNPVGYTHAVFDALFQAYLQRGAAGNSAGYTEASSKRGASRGPRGVRGVDDRSLEGLDWRSDKGKKKIATFVRNAAQHQYSMDALVKGAQLLGIEVNANATLHDLPIQQIREAVINNLSPAAEQGDAWALRAVGAALGVTGTFSAADLRAKVDAQYGIMSSTDCSPTGPFSNADLQHIAKAHNVTLKGKTKEEDCAALAAVVPRPEAGSRSISGRRQGEKTTAPRARKARGGKKAAAEVAGLVGQPAAAPPMSPRMAALFGRAAQPTQPVLPVGGTFFPVPTSPRATLPTLPGSPRQSPTGVVTNDGVQLRSPRHSPRGQTAPPASPGLEGLTAPTAGREQTMADLENLLAGL